MSESFALVRKYGVPPDVFYGVLTDQARADREAYEQRTREESESEFDHAVLPVERTRPWPSSW